MSKQSKAWARRRRRELITELGGKCVDCGETQYELLTFDHIYGKDWSARGKSTDQRMCHYVREHRQGLLTIRCNVCNARRGVPITAEEEERFMIDYPADDWPVPEITAETPF